MGVEREVERAALPQGEAQQPPERLVVHLPLVVAEWRGGVGPHRLAPVVAREQPRARMQERLAWGQLPRGSPEAIWMVIHGRPVRSPGSGPGKGPSDLGDIPTSQRRLWTDGRGPVARIASGRRAPATRAKSGPDKQTTPEPEHRAPCFGTKSGCSDLGPAMGDPVIDIQHRHMS